MGAKPFLKWAGGKGQLISSISNALPKDLGTRKNLSYVEPFVGSGAVLFWLLENYPNIKHAVINDINKDLILAYQVIKNSPKPLINYLNELQEEFLSYTNEEDHKQFFLSIREKFNLRKHDELTGTGLLIFLNKTCYNGLYRVNSKNEFNVPFGRYKNPRICDSETILKDSALLQKVTILNIDFEETLNYAEKDAFFYFDPPYKPISKTSSFTSYASGSFDDSDQERLARFCIKLHERNYQWILSNSDLKNTETENEYFDKLYKDFNIQRVRARRYINSVSSKRGEIFELLITNYGEGIGE